MSMPWINNGWNYLQDLYKLYSKLNAYAYSLNPENALHIRRTISCFNPLTPKITDFLSHFCPLLPKRKREYIMTKPCKHNVFGSPLSIYKVKITLSCIRKPIWRILLKKVPKIWNFFFYSFFFKWINILIYFKLWTKVDKIVVVYETYFLVQLLMFYLFQNGVKLWKFGK